jgi:hypothetical protein
VPPTAFWSRAPVWRGQKRVARELDQRVEQRTQELAAANKELRTAFDEIKALKDQLHKENIALREEINHKNSGL